MFTDPTGLEIKGVLRGLYKTTMGVFEANAGIAMAQAGIAGEFFSVGLSTSASAAFVSIGLITMVDGSVRTMLGIADIVVEGLDAFGKETIDGDVLPSSFGGIIGACIDKKNGDSFTDTGKVLVYHSFCKLG